MKYGAILAALFFSLSFVACGSDDDDDMFGMKQMVDDLEEMGKNTSSSDDMSSGSKKSSSSGSNYSSGEEEPPPEQVARTFIEFHYDSARKVTIGTSKYNDALINYTYRTVQVGPLIWLAENVRRDARTAMCYKDWDNKCETYGKLYQSASGLCPADFRLPRLEEWQQLIKIVGGASKLFSKTLWGDDGESGGKDEFGFTMLPGGICTKGSCSGLGTEANFFTEKGDVRGYVTFRYGKDSLEWHTINNDDDTHLSIRCVQPATSFQKESELVQVCDPKTEVDIAEGKKHFKCAVDSVWRQVLDTLPSSCSSKDENKRYLLSDSEYVCISGKIRQLTEIEEAIGRCLAKNEGDTATFKSTLYACRSSEWTQMKIEEIYGECTSAMDPTKIVLFNTSEYRCKDGAWKYVSRIERLRGFCTSAMEGDTAVVQDTFSTPESLVGPNGVQVVNIPHYQTRAYKCTNGDWKQCSTDEDYFGECTTQRQGKVDSFPNFVIPQTSHLRICDNGVWRIPAGIELRQGFCTKDRQDELVKDSSKFYVCTNGAWTEATIDNFPIPCDEAHEDSVYTISSKKIYCDVNQGKWRTPTGIEQNNGLCTKSKEGKTAMSGTKSFYLCTNRSWVAIDSMRYYLGECSPTSKNYRTVKTHKSKDYYCNGENWIVAVLSDILGTCAYSNARDTVRYKDTLYICKDNKWQQVTAYNVLSRCETSKKGVIEYNYVNHTNYVCDSYSWDVATMNDIETCTESKYGVVKKMPEGDNREFVCSDYYYSAGQRADRWRQLTPEDSAVGVCTPAQNGVVKEKNSSMYICTLNTELMYASHRWDSPSKKEAMDYKCSSASSGTVINYATQKNICDGKGGWSVEYGSVTIGGVAHKTVDFAGLTILAENLKAPTVNSKCYEGNNNQSCTHGRLYTIVDAYEACPTGWHLMDSVEYKTIENMARNYSGRFHTVDIFDSGNSAWQAASSGKNNDDVYGIGIFGTGYCDATGKCDYSMRESYLWTTDVVDLSTVYAVHHTYERKTEIVRMNPNAYLGARCVKDH